MAEAESSPATPAAGNQGAAPSRDDTNIAILMYILSIPTIFIAPLIIWILKKEQSPFLDDQGKEVLNWCITYFIAGIVCVPLMFVGIGAFLAGILSVLHVVFGILGALKAKDGLAYRYPFALRLLK